MLRKVGVKGEGPNQARVNEIEKQLLAILQGYIDKYRDIITDTLTLKGDAKYGKTSQPKGSMYSKIVRKISESDGMKELSDLANEIINVMKNQNNKANNNSSQQTQALNELNARINEVQKDLATQTRLALMDTGMQRAEDTTQIKERSKTNELIENIENKLSDNKESPTNKNMDSIRQSVQTSNSIADRSQQVLTSMAKALGAEDVEMDPASTFAEMLPKSNLTEEQKRSQESRQMTSTPLLGILQNINKNVAAILINVFKMAGGKDEGMTGVPALIRGWVGEAWGAIDTTRSYDIEDNRPVARRDITNWSKLYAERQSQEVEDEIAKAIEKNVEKRIASSTRGSTMVPTTPVYSSQKGFFGQLRKLFKDMMPMSEADRIMSATREEQELMRAERIERFGLNNGRQMTDTGDIASVRRTKELFGWIYSSDKDNQELFQDIRLTPGYSRKGIDTTKILRSLNDVLSGPEMFKAQTGGTLRNIIGSMTGYIGMPSLEKSRAQAEGLNQVMANVREEVLGLIQAINTEEATLRGMEKRGTVEFNEEGQMIKGTSSARKVFADMEEQKGVLKSALAEVKMIDQVVESTGGRISAIVRNLGFVMPELMQNNTILQNINAGLDKNGKAFKFQTRLAEILNYSFQLMSRYIGQIIKDWMWMINPLNQIKQRFDDFVSYDSKWQRTMNVIKYNLRDIIRPFMEWIAQSLVNIIGFIDIISMKIQEAFGYTPISLFDQKNADEFKKTYEEITSISAGFDELHDIGTSSVENDPNNLLGEIYKPELSQDWIDLANEIGDLFAGVITGDLGFGEAVEKILEIAWKGITTLWDEIIYPFVKETLWPFIQNNWLDILKWILIAFLAWKGLNVLGDLFWNAIFGKFTLSSIKNLFTKVGGWISSALSSISFGGFISSFGSGIMLAFQSLFAGGKYSLIGTLGEMFTNSAAITQAGSWGSMIGFALTKGLLATLAGYATYKVTDYFGDKAVDNENYNIGLMANGGKEEDKKSNTGNILGGILGGAAGGAVTGGIVAGPIGAAVGAVIGGIAGTLQTVLRPALEESQIAARNLNNELQNINFYEGAVDGAKESVNSFTEIQNLLSQAVEGQTDKVYKQGEQLGISKSRLDELIVSIQNGTYNTDMLSESELGLMDSLNQLSALQDKNKTATDNLTEAKRKLQKAEMDLAIMQDITAGNFELAAARIELAFASGVYTSTEAGKQMALVLKNTNDDMKANLLENLTPDMQKNFAEYVNTTEVGKKDLVKIYDELNEEQKEAFDEDYSDLFVENIENLLDKGQDAIDRTELDWSHPFQSLWKVVSGIWNSLFGGGNNTNTNNNSNTKSIPVATMAVGTNYVPNDGLAYLHQGEAVIPKKYNQPYTPANMSTEERAYMQQMMSTMRSLDSTIKQGININGQFVQRGSDLVAVVNKTKSQTGADLLSNVSYAR